jgi:hypothetical protein
VDIYTKVLTFSLGDFIRHKTNFTFGGKYFIFQLNLITGRFYITVT